MRKDILEGDPLCPAGVGWQDQVRWSFDLYCADCQADWKVCANADCGKDEMVDVEAWEGAGCYDYQWASIGCVEDEFFPPFGKELFIVAAG